MRILVTNDDGVHAEGLAVLVRELGRAHDVCVFAPDQERSGVSHAMTLRHPGKVRKLGEREFSCSGTPADCVILASLGALPFQPEIVVSGINRGPNLGTDIIYSGTCGAARQASLNGMAGIAVSCASFKEPLKYGAAAAFVLSHLERLVEECDHGIFMNINAPSSDDIDVPGEWAEPCWRRYRDRLRSFEAPDGYSYHFLADTTVETREDEGTDHVIVARGLVAVSPVVVHPQVPAGFIAGRRFE
ncbi:MAG TPA: 5'/3'-nucleotidase SurE [Rectinemataceae bacterium]|nr:5'/3'-nucleotidase SurE [Rectinemataceae bacterium]